MRAETQFWGEMEQIHLFVYKCEDFFFLLDKAIVFLLSFIYKGP